MMSTIEQQPASYRPAYETIASQIVDYIATAGLVPGDRLPSEQALGDRLGVSRSVVREAIKILSATGRVRVRRGAGLYVCDEPRPEAAAVDLLAAVDPEQVAALFDFRCTQELRTVQIATERITLAGLRALEAALERNRQAAAGADHEAFRDTDRAFHLTIAEIAGNPFLTAAVSSSFQRGAWVVGMVLTTSAETRHRSAAQHAALVAAIGSGQAEEAMQIMRAHLDGTLQLFQREMRRRLLEAGPR